MAVARALRAAVEADAFDKLAEASSLLTAGVDGRRVTVSVAPSFAAKWLMPRLGRTVLETAAREATGWDPALKVAVNLSPAQLEDDGIAGEIAAVLAETGLDPTRLEVEITEGMLIRDMARGIRILREIRALGVSVAMDDFGTGYSSLSYFRSFPFDKVKIDRSFIADMETNPHSLAIVQAVIGLGRGLGVPIVAEGVETEAQLARLRREGCDVVQGFHVGRPAGIAAFKDGRVLMADRPGQAIAA